MSKHCAYNLRQIRAMNCKVTGWALPIALALVVPAFSADPSFDLGVEQYRSRNYVEAEKTLRQVCERESDNPSAHEYLGLTLLELKRTDEGEAAIQKAAETGLAEDRVKVGLARAAIERRGVSDAARSAATLSS